MLDESNPNADQLAKGGMGVSSERIVDGDGIDGTGTRGDARTSTHGTLPTGEQPDISEDPAD